MPSLPQVACFDTAFHRAQPRVAQTFALSQSQIGAPFAIKRVVALSKVGMLCNKPPWGTLVALDLEAGKILWRSTVGTTEDRIPLGLTFKWGRTAVGQA